MEDRRIIKVGVNFYISLSALFYKIKKLRMELFGCLVGSQFILGKTMPNPDPEKAFNFFC